MFAPISTIMRHAGEAVFAVTAAVCVLVLSGLALVLTLVLAPPLKRLSQR
jgi:hypothetical protein